MTSSESAVAARRPRSLRILYADDMPELLTLMRIVLQLDGHRIECACDGRDALERLATAETAFDLVVTDHHMPLMNGLELVARLRALPYHGRIIVFSSELSPDIDAAYRRHGVDRILAKPILPSTFRAVVTELFREA